MSTDDELALALGRWIAGEDTAEDRAVVEAMDPHERDRQVRVAVALHGLGRTPGLAARVRSQLIPPRASQRLRLLARVRTAAPPLFRRPVVWGSLAAGLLLLLAPLWWASHLTEPAAEVLGPAVLADGRVIPLGNTGALIRGQGLSAGPGAEVRLVDGTRLAFEGDARLTWQEDGTWAASAGRLRWNIAHQTPGKVFRCRAGDTAIEVLGTTFTTESGGDWSKVLVEEGRVRASSGTAPALLLDVGGVALGSASDLRRLGDAVPLPITRRLADWLTTPGSPSGTLTQGQGPHDSPAILLHYNNDELPRKNWTSRFWATPQDWRQVRALSLSLLGTGTGRTFQVELAVTALGTPRGPSPRFIWEFTDTAGGWRQVVIPLQAFRPRLDLPEYPALAEDLPDWSRVHGLGLIATRGHGVVALADIAVLH